MDSFGKVRLGFCSLTMIRALFVGLAFAPSFVRTHLVLCFMDFLTPVIVVMTGGRRRGMHMHKQRLDAREFEERENVPKVLFRAMSAWLTLG